MTTVILCAGAIDYRELPLAVSESNAMIPVNGKPVIGWILDDLLRKGIDEAIVVDRHGYRGLKRFVSHSFGRRMALRIVEVSGNRTILHSLAAGIEQSPANSPVRIVLGDTLIRDSFAVARDMVYVGEVSHSRRWCLVELDGDASVVNYVDKVPAASGQHQALAGYYHLLDGELIRRCLQQSLDADESELSDFLRRYGRERPIMAVRAEQWFDFGHLDGLLEAKRRLIASREFNTLSVDPVLNTITKVSERDRKLRDELRWFLDLPDELKVLTPRIVHYEEVDERLQVTQEYYGYPTLAELYLYGQLSDELWSAILRRLFQIHGAFRSIKGVLSVEDIRAMYVDKTKQRLAELGAQGSQWSELMESDGIELNGERLHNVGALRGFMEAMGERLAQTAEVTVIHGDYCFSNILFDINNQIVRLIDPRGSFGKPGIYGDPRYDIAKLRHSVHGAYDFIVNDMFDITRDGASFDATIHEPDLGVVRDIFDRSLVASGYDELEVTFVEGLLFLSMVTLHAGEEQRQQVMYLTGLRLLNRVYDALGKGESVSGARRAYCH